jgi:hypothetical protein
MSAFVTIVCDCTPACGETTIVDGVETRSQARAIAEDRGWYRDTLPGGNTYIVAPGHRLGRAS